MLVRYAGPRERPVGVSIELDEWESSDRLHQVLKSVGSHLRSLGNKAGLFDSTPTLRGVKLTFELSADLRPTKEEVDLFVQSVQREMRRS